MVKLTVALTPSVFKTNKMAGVIRLIHNNAVNSVRAVYKYKNKFQMRSIILLWQHDLGERMNQYWVHAIPEVTIEPETIKDLKFYELEKINNETTIINN